MREAFRRRGHDAISCDLLPSEDNSKYHYQGDCFDLIGKEYFDLMIAHPDCTYLAVSGLHWNKRGVLVDGVARSELTEKALEFVVRLMNAPIDKIAIENPISCISTRIRKPDQIIQPHWFGDNASKKTCLWLKNLKPLAPTKFVEGELYCCGEKLENDDRYGCPYCLGEKRPKRIWANQTPSGQNKLGPSDDRWKERSRTFQGFADAAAEQWGGIILDSEL